MAFDIFPWFEVLGGGLLLFLSGIECPELQFCLFFGVWAFGAGWREGAIGCSGWI